jgi:hypothetical protein
MSTHTQFWKKYKIRPSKKDSETKTNEKYCMYDKAHNDFLYTKEWIEFLIEKMNEPGIYESLFLNKETN